MNLRSVKIGKQLGIGFGIILVWIILVVAACIYINEDVRRHHNTGMALATKKFELAGEMRGAILEGGLAMRNVGLQYSTPDMLREEAKLAVQRKRFKVARDKLTSLGLSDAESALVSRIFEVNRQTDAPFREAIDLIKAYSNESAGKLISSRIDPLDQQAIAAIDTLIRMQHQAIDSLIAESGETGKKIAWIMALTGLVTVIMCVTVSLFTARGITRPLKDAVKVAQRVAAGRIGGHIAVSGKDETSELLAALKEMDASLSNIVIQVRQGTDAINTASQDISAGNADLSIRTESQASALQETASSMEQLTQAVRQNTQNALNANELAQTASASATKGGTIVSDVVATMSEVKASSRKIVDIIGVIDGIAFQTNILALNAAVEAARAGEQGRGFAVVASEVRTLAQRSSQAAKEIKGLINSTVDQVENGNLLVEDAGRQMNEILEVVHRLARIMHDITDESSKQSMEIEEISRAITTMDNMTQHNAALVEQAAAASGEMSRSAASLDRAVAAFDLNRA
jgi:methyl-accepting chemotaxis protein